MASLSISKYEWAFDVRDQRWEKLKKSREKVEKKVEKKIEKEVGGKRREKCRGKSSLRSRRLEVVGERENRRARKCLLLALPFFPTPTSSKRLLRRPPR